MQPSAALSALVALPRAIPWRMPAVLRSVSLKTRILLLVMVLALSGIWFLAARATAMLERDIEKLVAVQMRTTVHNVVDDLVRDIKVQLHILGRAAASVTPAMLRDPTPLGRYLKQRQAMGALFPGSVLVADARGRVVAASPPAGAGASIADTEYFRELMAEGKPVVGSPVEEDRLRPVPLAVPIRDARGATIGALVGLVPLSDEFMLGQLAAAQLGRSGYFLIACRDERMIIAASQPDRAGTRLPARGVIADLDQRLDEGFEGARTTMTAIGVEVVAVSRAIPMTDWVLLAGVPTREAFAPIATLTREIYGSALAVSLLLLAVLGWVMKREFARIERAGEAMRRMTSGRRPFAPIPVTRDDEIGRLKQNFNCLVAERNRLDDALRSEVGAHREAREALEDAMQRLQALTGRMTRMQEEERRKLAFELHEQAGQDLVALKMHLQILEAQAADAQAKRQLRDAQAVLAQALERMRSLSLDLHPRELNEFGLYAALRAHSTELARASGWTLHFDAPESGERTDPDVELACFRVAEEALANAAQHAQATEVRVCLRRSGDELELRVRDDGVGFEPARASRPVKATDLGLMAMCERVRQVAGRLEVRSAPGDGTEIRAAFPLRARAAVLEGVG